MSSRIFTRRWTLFAATSAFILASSAVQGETGERAEQAGEFLTQTDRLISQILVHDGYSPDDKRSLIDSLLDERLDLPVMARAALGSHEEHFSREQLSEFIQEYSRFLTHTYLQEIAWSDPKDIAVHEASAVDAKTGWVRIDTKSKPRSSMANQQAQYRQSSVFRAVYVLRERHGTWRIVKISFNGVDLNRSFGSQFDAVLKQHTPEELLKDLHELNNRRDAKNPLA